ncbi:hypothetical protein ACVDFE_30740 [Lentzea chajnantorensis]
MGELQARRRAGVVVGAVVFASVLAGVVAAMPSDGPAIERAEAEALLDEAVRLAPAGDHGRFCESVAQVPGICRGLVDDARSSGQAPGGDRPVVVSFEPGAGSIGGSRVAVLRLRATNADRSVVESDFAVVRSGDGRLAGLTPVYWSGVTYSAR